MGVTLLVQTLPWGQGWNFWERKGDKKRLTHIWAIKVPTGSSCPRGVVGNSGLTHPERAAGGGDPEGR